MKILVTGGAGYIGSHAVYMLIKNGHTVVVADNLSTGFKENIHKEAKFYEGDISNKLFLSNIFEDESDIEAVMHFAGSIRVDESIYKPLEYFKNNADAVRVLLSACQNSNISTFIFSSTAAIYGQAKTVPIDELDEKNPMNPYGESKLAAENLIKSWCDIRDVNFVIFRYFNVAGAHSNGKLGIKSNNLTHLIPLIVKSAIDKKEIFRIFGDDFETEDGTCVRDFIHVQDLVEAHLLGLEWSIKNERSGIFNLGSEKGYSVKQVYDTATQVLKIEIPFEIIEKRFGDPAKIYASTILAKEILKWKPKYNLKKIIMSEYKFRLKFTKDSQSKPH